jgi:hypothetical protein
MDKKYVINKIGGGSITTAAQRLGIARQTIYQWPDELPDHIRRMVIGWIAENTRRKPRVTAEGKVVTVDDWA